MTIVSIPGLPIDLDYGDNDPADWRNGPEPDDIDMDDDEDLPCPPDVLAAIGFDPDELWPKDEK